MWQRKHISKFTCIGSDCIDHCCGEWGVKLNPEDLKLLQKNLSEQEQSKLIKPYGSFHKINQKNGMCAAQCQSGLCTIQQRFGHDALPSVCASFPRFYGKNAQREELGGFLSCPEISRISLLHPDGQIIENNSTFGKAVLDLDISTKTEVYFSKFDQIRTLIGDLIQNKNYDLSTLLYAIGEFSKRSPAFFNRNSNEDKVEILISDLNKAIDETPEFTNEDSSLLWDAIFKEANRFANQKLPYVKPGKLLREVLGHYENSSDFVKAESLFWKRERVELEAIWRRYLLHDWNVRWYAHSADLVMHWERTFFKWALIRMMVTSFDKEWKSKLVQCVYSIERLVEHTVWQRQFARAFWSLRLPVSRLFLAFHPRSTN